MKLSRRNFLTAAGGATLGAAALGGLALSQNKREALLEAWTNREEEHKTSVCGFCPAGCGLVARLMDGQVVGVAGNPIHPVNWGGVCPRGMVSHQWLNHPDRLAQPLARTGPRGSGQFNPISWDQALSMLAGRLKDLRQKGAPQQAAMVHGPLRGQQRGLMERFWQAYGSPNRFVLGEDPLAAPAHQRFAQGLERPLAFDLSQARCILSFGFPLLDGGPSPVQQQVQFSAFRSRAENEAVNLIQVESRLSATGRRADHWVAVHPGTERVFALGVAHLLLASGRYDKSFVENHTSGFASFKKQVLEGFSPEATCLNTGVEAEVLAMVADAFAYQPGQAGASIALAGGDGAYGGGDLTTALAIHSLNALSGAFGRPGGAFGLSDPPFSAWPTLSPDATGQKGLKTLAANQGLASWEEAASCRTLAANLAAGQSQLDTLIFFEADPVHSQPNGDLWAQALEKVGLVVAMTPLMDDTAVLADLVLPLSTPLESWMDSQQYSLAGFSVVSLSGPVIPPLHDTRQGEDLMLQLAASVGGPVAKALPYKDYQALLRFRLAGLQQSGQGKIVQKGEGKTLEVWLQGAKNWPQPKGGFDVFWNELAAKGAWVETRPAKPGRLFNTKDGRYNFFRPELAEPFQPKDLCVLPPPPNPKATSLVAYTPLSLRGPLSASQPLLQQRSGGGQGPGWGSWVELNPHTAHDLGLEEGDEATLEAGGHKMVLPVVVNEGIHPHTVVVPLGQGHSQGGRWAAGVGQNTVRLLAGQHDALTGRPLTGGAKIKISG